MHLAVSIVAFLTLFSFLSISTAVAHPSLDNVIRVALERKSLITRPRWQDRPNNVAGFLKTHLVSVAMKYRATLAVYELNTGSRHPLAQAISATSTGLWVAGQNASDIGATLPAGRLERRQRKRDATVDRVTPVDSTPSSHVSQSRHAKRDGISLSEVNSNMWIGSISVGTPPQNFTVDFDTGSSDLVLPAQACDNTCNGHTRYNPAASSTSLDLGGTFQLTYAGGSQVNGSAYADNVYMGGYEAINQTFGAATTYSTWLKSPTFRPDGLLGMAFPMISVFGTPSVFQTMVSSGLVPEAVFGFALSPESGKSELTIGGTDTAKYQGSTTEYVNVTLPAYWQIRMAGLTRPGLNGAPDVVVVNKTSYAEAIIDTGTTLIITSDSNAQAYYTNVTGAKLSTQVGGGAWTVPCDIIDSLAPTLTFGTRSFTVSSSTFNLGPVSEGSTDCVAGVAGGGSDYWIVGDVFLQNVYAIFDIANNRVGFADLA